MVPSSIAGAKLLWKKAQKKEKKKQTSDKINRSILIRNLNSNLWVWNPIILSRLKSFHHKNLIHVTRNTENSTLHREILNLNHITTLEAVENSIKESKKGQKEVCTGRKGLINIILKLKYKKYKSL